jgi:SAM-dependent methyltransferase
VNEDVWQVRADRPFEDAYWAYMRLKGEIGAKMLQPAIPWWMQGADCPGLNPTEQAILDHVSGAKRLLDIGAGDLRVKNRLQRAGFAGSYETVDRSIEAPHEYNDLADAPTGIFDAVLILEVIEHIKLDDFDMFIDGVLRVLAPGGRIAISTPNSAFISTVWADAIEHRHPYPALDLAAYLQIRGAQTHQIYRINWAAPSDPLAEKIRRQVARVVMRGLLRVDYCRGILLLGAKI